MSTLHIPPAGFVASPEPMPPEAIAAGAPQPPTDVDAILTQRGEVYGRFVDNAAISQGLKRVLAQALMESPLPDDMAEALDMFCAKMSRIVTGAHNYTDSWADLEGYARLVRERLEGRSR